MNEVMNRIILKISDNQDYLKAIAIVFLIVLMMLCQGCVGVDFSKKALAVESKIYGIHLVVPSTESGESFAKADIGIITTRYISAPQGGKVTIVSSNEDVNIWTLSGNVKTEMSVDFKADSIRE